MKLGEVLHAEIGSTRFPTMRVARTDARNAAAKTLAAFLMEQTFTVGAGDDGKEKRFQLKDVLFTFPHNATNLQYPSASITTPTSTQEAHNLSPTPLEETVDRYGSGTVLWKTAELVAQFQVDFFANDEPTIEAIAAVLPAIFSPREDASGVLLRGPEAYWCLTVRCTLTGDPERFGDGEAVYEGERRLIARVRSELDVVHLRKAIGMRRPRLVLDALDPKA